MAKYLLLKHYRRNAGPEDLVGVPMDQWSPDEAVVECREAVRRFAVDVRRDDVTCVALALARDRDAAQPV